VRKEVSWKTCEPDQRQQHAGTMVERHMENEPGAVVGATVRREKDRTIKEWRLECQEESGRRMREMGGRLPGLTVAVAGDGGDVGRTAGCCRGQVQVPFRLDLKVRSRVARTFGRGSTTAVDWVGGKGDAIEG